MAHAHMIQPIQGTDLIVAADLGADKLYLYNIKDN